MKAKNSVRLLALSLLFSCGSSAQVDNRLKHELDSETRVPKEELFQVGAERLDTYLNKLEGKRVAIVANQTSVIGDQHLVDTLISRGVDVVHVYAPEHGFRGKQDAGAKVLDERDSRTGLQIYSLHGKTKKPTQASLREIDIVLFDIQDVGVRFYTYISTLHYVMEACAEQSIPVIILDRPNPNISYEVDGPVLDTAFASFIGMHPVPVLHGLTIGEYGLMINGQGWLEEGKQTYLTVIPCSGYNRTTDYVLPIAPSPNLPNQKSIYLYPSLCFFEGTVVSVGRGTDKPFQWIGHPDYVGGDVQFTPMPNAGSRYPKLEGQLCKGIDYTDEEVLAIRKDRQLSLTALLEFNNTLALKEGFFRSDGFFDLLAGTDELRKQILTGLTEKEIRLSWEQDLMAYRKMSSRYRLYE